MAHALKIKAVVSSRTLTLSDLDAFIGKHVEVTVAEDESMDVDAVPDHAAPPVRRRFGTMAGKIEIAEDFDQPLPPDIQRYFEGETD